MIEFIGWFGNALFAISAVPQAVRCFKQGHARGVSHAMLWCWVIGELCALFYGLAKDLPPPLLMNYTINLLSIAVILYYRYFGGYKK